MFFNPILPRLLSPPELIKACSYEKHSRKHGLIVAQDPTHLITPMLKRFKIVSADTPIGYVTNPPPSTPVWAAFASSTLSSAWKTLDLVFLLQRRAVKFIFLQTGTHEPGRKRGLRDLDINLYGTAPEAQVLVVR